ncbi:hypothetical protein JYT16_01920 [Gemmatimonas aurantiaca]|nr:hypothetical protein [Gemmatimonas aurantiaca]
MIIPKTEIKQVVTTSPIGKRTRLFLYFFIAAQPLAIILLVLDMGLDVLEVSRKGLFLAIALPWGLAVATALSALAELGLNTGRNWIRWVFALALVYGVEAYALKEIYLNFIIPVNFILFPALALILSHFLLRDER